MPDYIKIIDELETRLIEFKQKSKIYSMYRVTAFILGVAAIVILYNISSLYASLLIPVFLIGFYFLIRFHHNKEKGIRKTRDLIKIYENELSEKNIFGDGSVYTDHKHLYASDLDIFGRFSVFNMINRTVTEEGSKILASWLKQKRSKDQIILNQQAAREMSDRIEFKENFLRTTFYVKDESVEDAKFVEWVKKFGFYFTEKKVLQLLSWLFPILFWVSSITSFFIYEAFFVSGFIFFTNMFLLIRHKLAVDKIQNYTGKRGALFAKYAVLIKLFKNESFESVQLSSLKEKLFKYYKPHHQMKKLAALSDMLDNRLNMIFALVNLVTLWDFHISLGIEKWFKKNSEDVSEWMEIIGTVDALLSIGVLYYNHPDWCVPKINEKDFRLVAESAGHPLITKDQRVNNDYEMSGTGNIDIITGSNMAGKSTFLRTIGVNMVLSYIGAPVCAQNFETSVTDILSYFRIHDSLEESTSSFYAELKRIKDILERSAGKNNSFILLDELLRGTNTSDRHKGSVAVIKQLIRNNAVGMVATHDLALADMKKDYPENIRNYHFDVSVKDEELFFDYKIKAGICQSFNATLLMKKIGIEL